MILLYNRVLGKGLVAFLICFGFGLQAFAQGPTTWVSGSQNLAQINESFGFDFTTEPPTINIISGKGWMPYLSHSFSDSTGTSLGYAIDHGIINRYGEKITTFKAHATPFRLAYMIKTNSSGRYLYFAFPHPAAYFDNVVAGIFDPYANSGHGKLIEDIDSIFPLEGKVAGTIIPYPNSNGTWVIYAQPKTRKLKTLYFDGESLNEKAAFYCPFSFSLTGTWASIYGLHSSNGSLSPSHKGDKLVMIADHSIYLLNFNPLEGTIDSLQLIDEWRGKDPNSEIVELPGEAVFSPNDSLLYITANSQVVLFNNENYREVNGLYQYNLYPEKGQSIKDTRTAIDTDYIYTGIQMGADRKLWLHTFGGLNYLKYPDSLGAASKLVELFPPTIDKTYSQLPHYIYTLPFILNNQWVNFRYRKLPCNRLKFDNISDSLFTSFTWYVYDVEKDTAPQVFPGRTMPPYAFSKPGKYFVKLKGTSDDGYTAWYSDSVTFAPGPAPQIWLQVPDIVCEDISSTFSAGLTGRMPEARWQWSINGTTSYGNSITYNFTDPGDYPVNVHLSDNGCEYDSAFTVTVMPLADAACDGVRPYLWIPNSFSPNEDGVNDLLRVESNALSSFSLIVYNKWGEKLFETHEPQFTWNGRYKGRTIPSDVYIYQAQALGEDGTTWHEHGALFVK